MLHSRPKYVQLSNVHIVQILFLQVRILRCESLPTNYRTATATTSVKLSILPTKLPKVKNIRKIKILQWQSQYLKKWFPPILAPDKLA